MVCRKSNAIIAISMFILLYPVASHRQGWSRQMTGCSLKDGSNISEVYKKEKLCTTQQPLAAYLLSQQQSLQSLPGGKARGPQLHQCSKDRDGAGQDLATSFPTKESLGEWGWANLHFTHPPWDNSFQVLLETWFHTSAEKTDTRD